MGFGCCCSFVIIIKYRMRIQQGTIFLVVKKEIALYAEIARVLLSPLVIDCHLGRKKNLTDWAFPATGPDLKCQEWVVRLILWVLRVYQSHIPYHHDMFAVTLHDRQQPQVEITLAFLILMLSQHVSYLKINLLTYRNMYHILLQS